MKINVCRVLSYKFINTLYFCRTTRSMGLKDLLHVYLCTGDRKWVEDVKHDIKPFMSILVAAVCFKGTREDDFKRIYIITKDALGKYKEKHGRNGYIRKCFNTKSKNVFVELFCTKTFDIQQRRIWGTTYSIMRFLHCQKSYGWHCYAIKGFLLLYTTDVHRFISRRINCPKSRPKRQYSVHDLLFTLNHLCQNSLYDDIFRQLLETENIFTLHGDGEHTNWLTFQIVHGFLCCVFNSLSN